MITRTELRKESAKYLNSLTADELFENWGITAVRKIDGLDVIGVPVWSTTRPLAKRISHNAGKALYDDMARAGAIAEAIEFAVFDEEFTSNGQALGYDYNDALLQGIFEVVERDAITISTHIWRTKGIQPPRYAPFEFVASTYHLMESIKAADLKLFIYNCSLDLKFPVFWAIICDPFGGLEHFGGWGCHLDPTEALNRAILEAIQSRAVIIAGARDDLDRHNLAFLRSIDQCDLIKYYESTDTPIVTLEPYRSNNTEEMLLDALNRLSGFPIEWDRVKVSDELKAVKVTIKGLEGPIWHGWQPGERCKRFSS